jgi:phosphatidylinositol-3-phosphatase
VKASTLAVSLCLLTACGAQAQPAVAQSASPLTSPVPSQPVRSPSSAQASHVFVIVLENHDYAQALTGRYTERLASEYPIATNYHGVSHPSLPNYLALTSGSTWGIADDGYHRLPAGGLGAQLTAAGIQWRAYMEGMTRGCLNSPYPYALKHNPFAYYGNGCSRQVVPFTQFAADMKGNVPSLVWITPDMCHDGHDCSMAVTDVWLSQTVPTILATSAWQQNGLLLITWDEGEDSANHVLTLVIHPHPLARASGRAYNHYSLLATIEDRLGVSRLGLAAHTNAMTDLLASTPGS